MSECRRSTSLPTSRRDDVAAPARHLILMRLKPETCSGCPASSGPGTDDQGAQDACIQGREHEIQNPKRSLRSSLINGGGQWPARPPSPARTRGGPRGSRRCRRINRRRRRAAGGRSVEPRARHHDSALWRAVAVRGQDGAHADQSKARTTRQRGAHAPSFAQRHDHAERPAFRDRPRRFPRHRSGQAQALDPRPREAADGIHARRAAPLSDGVAGDVPRMRRQQRAAVFQGRRSRQTSRRSTASFPARNGRAYGSRRCWKKSASIPAAEWFLAEGADAPTMHRSIPRAEGDG